MQRKSTRKTTPTLELSSSYEEGKIINDETEVNCIHKKHNSREITLPNIITFLKYLIVCILLLPWIVNLTSRVKENDYLPKLQKMLEESFACPKMGSYNNCTCDDKSQQAPSL